MKLVKHFILGYCHFGSSFYPFKYYFTLFAMSTYSDLLAAMLDCSIFP